LPCSRPNNQLATYHSFFMVLIQNGIIITTKTPFHLLR
jgi:hypothetical protein